MLLMSAIVDIDGSLSFHVAVMICRFLRGWETIFRYHDPQPLFEKTWRLLPDKSPHGNPGSTVLDARYWSCLAVSHYG
jgi:hypothetical protein